MSSVQHLREFIRERLTAAAEEIFTEVEKTIISYEEELDAQRRMMGISWKPDIKLHRVGSELQRQSSDLQQPSVSSEEEASAIQQVQILANCSSDNKKHAEHQRTEEEPMGLVPRWIKKEEEEPEPILLKHEEIEYSLTSVIKEELDSSVLQHEQQPSEHLPTGQDQKDLCRNHERELLVQKPFVSLLETSTLQEDMNEEEARTEKVSLHVSPVVESKDHEGSSSSVSLSQSDTNSKKRSFKCDICGRIYPQQCELKKHYRTHTDEKPFSCESCGKSFSRKSNLKVHKRIHTGEKPFSCESCRKSFRRGCDLNVHKSIHTGEKPFSCESCGKSFRQIRVLNEHKKIHTGERPFSCESCRKSFRRVSHLNVHKKIHTGEKPFSCDSCRKSFRRLSYLNVHKKIHTGEKPFPCESCGKSFSRIRVLNEHKRIHTGERPFSCESCGKSFRRMTDLNVHKKIHTGKSLF